MMNFIIMTLSFTVAILLSSVICMLVILNTKVLNWYLAKVQKLTMKMFEDLSEPMFKDEELV